MRCALVLAIVLLCRPCSADSISYSTLLDPATTNGYSGSTLGPNGHLGQVVAQPFYTHREFGDITGEVSLTAGSQVGGQPATISFVLAANDNGAPGAALSSADVTLTVAGLSNYEITFPGVILLDEQTYWLVASSDDGSAGSLPSWALSKIFSTSQILGSFRSQNSGPWIRGDFNGGFNTQAFAMFGTDIGDPIPLPDPVPEPASLVLVGTGIIAARARRQLKRHS
jgi:hypothetical protein